MTVACLYTPVETRSRFGRAQHKYRQILVLWNVWQEEKESCVCNQIFRDKKQQTKNLYTRIGGHGGGSTLVLVHGLCADQMFQKCPQRKTIINIFHRVYLLMRLIHVARKTVSTCAPFWVPFGVGLHLHAHQMNLANCRRKTVMTLSNATVNSQIKGGVE